MGLKNGAPPSGIFAMGWGGLAGISIISGFTREEGRPV